MIVRRCSLGGYHVGTERWPSVTEIQRELPDSSFEYAGQNVFIQRMAQFLADAQAGHFPPSFRETLELWGEKASSVTVLKWLGSDSGQRWLAAAKTIQDNAWKDRGTILHRFKDQLAQNPVWSHREVLEWLEGEITSEGELAKMTLKQYQDWLSGERTEELDFKAWHDRFCFDRPQRAFDCTHEEVAPYLLSLSEWWQEEAPEIVWLERTLINSRKKYVGTADGLLFWRGRLFLSDFKSTKQAGAKDYHAAQLGGYYGCSHYHDKESGELVPFEWPEGMGLIVFAVTPKKVYPYEVKKPADAVSVFNAVHRVTQSKGMFHDFKSTERMNRKEKQTA